MTKTRIKHFNQPKWFPKNLNCELVRKPNIVLTFTYDYQVTIDVNIATMEKKIRIPVF